MALYDAVVFAVRISGKLVWLYGVGRSAVGQKPSMVLYFSFYKFLLAVESRDLSQADKSIIMVSSFPS